MLAFDGQVTTGDHVRVGGITEVSLMPIPVQTEVEAVLARNNRAATLHRVMSEAWTAYQRNPDRGWHIRKTTGASLVWEHAVRLAKQYFADDPDVTVLEHHETVSFIFDGKVLLRFKKGDVAMRASNIPTKTAMDFYEHEVDMFGQTGLQRVQAIYILDRLGASMMWTGIVARQGNSVMWEFPLNGGEIQRVLPLPQQQAAQKPVAQLAKLKGTGQDAKEDESKKAQNDNDG